VFAQASFGVHLAAAVLVVATAAWLQVSRVEWCLLLLCIASVFTAELFNSALESLAKAVDQQHNEHLRDALDIASGAVLVAAMGAAAVGATVLLPHFLRAALW
jgi:diacylglycerol kinase